MTLDERNAKIVRLHDQGISAAVLAVRFGVGKSRINTIVQEWKARQRWSSQSFAHSMPSICNKVAR